MTDRDPPTQRTTSVLIIGGGPGGYVAGIRCGQLGVEAIVVDDQPLGGTCLNVGCIPSKALIHAADEFAKVAESGPTSPLGISVASPTIDLSTTMAWKDGIVTRLNQGVGSLLKRAGTEVLVGRARVIDGKTVEVMTADGERIEVRTEHLVLATGSTPIELPGLPFGDSVLSSTGALALDTVPRTMAVVGGGYIGVELGTAFAKLGTHVSIIEAEDRILPLYDAELTNPVARRLAELDVTVMTETRADARTDAGLLIIGSDGSTEEVEAEVILVTVGRRPTITGWGLETLPLTMNGPSVAVDERGHTSMHQVWAIGDLTGEPMLAHRAMKQGEIVAEAIAGRPAAFDALAVPAIVFGDPEVVTVGLAPADAESIHGEVIVGRFPLSANGRSMTLDRTAGFVRVVARSDNHLVLGIQAVGAAVAELAAAFGLAIEMGARLEDLAGTIHAHPSTGEAIPEAALDALGRALHR